MFSKSSITMMGYVDPSFHFFFRNTTQSTCWIRSWSENHKTSYMSRPQDLTYNLIYMLYIFMNHIYVYTMKKSHLIWLRGMHLLSLQAIVFRISRHYQCPYGNFCKSSTDITIFPFLFKLNGIWSWWKFSFWFWTKWNSIYVKIEMNPVTTIISH